MLASEDGGRYPYGHSMIVEGSEEHVLIDPSLSVAASAALPDIDRLLISHAHEDHLSGVFRYPAAPIHAHEADVDGLRSLDGLMAVYGMAPETEARWRREVVDRFYFVPRPDAVAFREGDRFDVGGAALHVIHLPGHTSGHSAFMLEPDGVLFLADIDRRCSTSSGWWLAATSSRSNRAGISARAANPGGRRAIQSPVSFQCRRV